MSIRPTTYEVKDEAGNTCLVSKEVRVNGRLCIALTQDEMSVVVMTLGGLREILQCAEGLAKEWAE